LKNKQTTGYHTCCVAMARAKRNTSRRSFVATMSYKLQIISMHLMKTNKLLHNKSNHKQRTA